MTAPRRRRRAVGPPGARPVADEQPDAALREPAPDRPRDVAAEEQRLRADRPPHHDRGV